MTESVTTPASRAAPAIHELPLGLLRDAADAAITVAAAAEVGIFQGLATGAATPAELAHRLELNARAVEIVLPVLLEMNLVVREGGRYALSEAGRRQLGDPQSSEYAGRGLSLWLRNVRRWAQLDEVLRTGQPQREAPSGEMLVAFMEGMAAAPAARVRRTVEACLERRPQARTALDLGGGPGLYAREFVRAGLEVTMYDTPEVIEHVADAYGLRGVPGLRLVSGDLTRDALPAGPFDIVLLSNLTHIFSPEQNLALLRKVGDVVPTDGLVAIADTVRERSPRAARMGVLMLLGTEQGNTYDEAQYRAWLQEAGFGQPRTEELEPERQLISALRR